MPSEMLISIHFLTMPRDDFGHNNVARDFVSQGSTCTTIKRGTNARSRKCSHKKTMGTTSGRDFWREKIHWSDVPQWRR